MKKIICLLLSFTLIISLFGCSSKANKRYTTTYTDSFDTVTTIVAYDSSQKAFNASSELLQNELNRYNQLFDIYSEAPGNLGTLNKTAMEAPVKVEKDVIELLKYGKEAYKESDGKLNICFGSVLELWTKARETAVADEKKAYIPDMKELKKASRHTNPDDLVIDEKNSTVFFKDKGLRLDVGAIAKGWTAQRLTEFISENGLWESYMLNLGGNVVTKGFKENDGSSKWNIEIQNPNPKSSTPAGTLSLTDRSVVTSGNYQRFFVYDGKSYCHIIDTKTLMPARYYAGVTVICEDSALADRLTTQLFVMPIDEGKKLVESLDGVEALWINLRFGYARSSGFDAYKMQ